MKQLLKKSDERKLTDKQRVFVAEYCVDRDSGRAAKAAGYKGNPKSLGVMGCKLKDHPLIRKAIESVLSQDAEDCELRREEVLKELKRCLTRDARKLFDERGILIMNWSIVNGKTRGRTINDLPDELMSSVDGVKQKVRRYTVDKVEYLEVETELKLVSKSSVLDMAMKHKGLYAPDKVDVRQASIDLNQLFRPPEELEDLVERAIFEVGKPPRRSKVRAIL